VIRFVSDIYQRHCSVLVNLIVLFSGLFPDDAKQCSAFLRHKMYLITPRTLRENSIPFVQVCAGFLYFVKFENVRNIMALEVVYHLLHQFLTILIIYFCKLDMLQISCL